MHVDASRSQQHFEAGAPEGRSEQEVGHTHAHEPAAGPRSGHPGSQGLCWRAQGADCLHWTHPSQEASESLLLKAHWQDIHSAGTHLSGVLANSKALPKPLRHQRVTSCSGLEVRTLSLHMCQTWSDADLDRNPKLPVGMCPYVSCREWIKCCKT